MNEVFPIRPSEFRKPSRTPLYARLQHRLQELIEAGHWPPNAQIPTERDIAQATGISINTIKQALSNLVRDGYLYRRQGQGTFVASPESFFGLHRYYAMRKDFNSGLERHKKTILSLQAGMTNPTAEAFFTDRGETRFYRLERLLHVGGKKTIYTCSWLPEHIFAGFEKLTSQELEHRPLYEVLACEFQAPCRISRELLSVRLLDAKTAALLDVEEGHPALYSQMVATSYNETTIEVRESFILTDDVMLHREF